MVSLALVHTALAQATEIDIDYTGANGIQGINSNLTCTRCKFYQHGILTSSRKPVSAIYLTSQYLVRGYLTLSIASSNFTPSHDVPIAARDSVISATNITHIWISESRFNLHRFNGRSRERQRPTAVPVAVADLDALVSP